MAMNPKVLEALEASVVTEDSNKFIRALIYGDFGIGKSTWAAKSGKKTLFIDTSSGYIVLKDYDNITVLEYKGLSQIEAVAQAIQEKIPGWDYEVVVIDEISTIYQMDLELVTGANAKKQGDVREETIPEMRDYLAAQNRLMKSLRPLLATDVHLILLCHERRTVDKTTGVAMIESDLAPRLSKEVNRGLHVLGRMSVSKQGVRELVVNPARNVQAKNRLGLSDNPTLINVLEKF